jgi:hypothetical protein
MCVAVQHRHAYVHQFFLPDFEARGFSRQVHSGSTAPHRASHARSRSLRQVCVAYITKDRRKLDLLFQTLCKHSSDVAALLKGEALRQYRLDIQHRAEAVRARMDGLRRGCVRADAPASPVVSVFVDDGAVCTTRSEHVRTEGWRTWTDGGELWRGTDTPPPREPEMEGDEQLESEEAQAMWAEVLQHLEYLRRTTEPSPPEDPRTSRAPEALAPRRLPSRRRRRRRRRRCLSQLHHMSHGI